MAHGPLILFCMMIDIGPKFYSAKPLTMPKTLSSRSWAKNFYVKVLLQFLIAHVFRPHNGHVGPKLYSAIPHLCPWP